MIDLDLLLARTDWVAERLAGKKVEPSLVFNARDAVLDRRAINARLDTKRAEMNRRSKDLGRLMAQRAENVDEERASLSELKADIADLEEQYRKAIDTADELLYRLPNLPHPAAPIGVGEEENVVLRYEGPKPTRRTDTRPHWDIAAELGLLDLKRAAKLSGSGFPVLYGDGARLLRALVQLALDLHRDRYLELVVPHFVRRETPMATGHLPKFADDMYNTTLDDLWAVPTGELPLTALHRDEILSAEDLPKRYMTYTSCFRREAGSAGKDTRGMQRLHEFHKVELVQLCHPSDVEDRFLELLADCERALQLLELPYRVVDLCTGDLTFSSSRIYDLEVYAPGLDKWLECSSVGNFTDFQARRGNIRYRETGGTAPVNTLNGSAMATPRVWSAILEHGLQPDGTVRVPEVLVPYVGKDTLARDARAPR